MEELSIVRFTEVVIYGGKGQVRSGERNRFTRYDENSVMNYRQMEIDTYYEGYTSYYLCAIVKLYECDCGP